MTFWQRVAICARYDLSKRVLRYTFKKDCWYIKSSLSCLGTAVAELLVHSLVFAVVLVWVPLSWLCKPLTMPVTWLRLSWKKAEFVEGAVALTVRKHEEERRDERKCMACGYYGLLCKRMDPNGKACKEFIPHISHRMMTSFVTAVVCFAGMAALIAIKWAMAQFEM